MKAKSLYEDPFDFFRGVLVAALFAVPLWAAIIWFGWKLYVALGPHFERWAEVLR